MGLDCFAAAMTQKYTVVAIRAIARLMTDSVSPGHMRVTAAVAMLWVGSDGIELDDLSARVE